MIFCENANASEKVEAVKARESELRLLSNKGQLRCPIPTCQKQVIFKCGSKKIPHFAHKTQCSYPDHEPESQQHLTGKLALRDMLSRIYPESKVEVEAWISETGQEADVLVIHPDSTRWAFEYQCSKISGEKWKLRHELYRSANIKDFWIPSDSLIRKSIAKDTEFGDRWLLCDFVSEIYSSQSSSRVFDKIPDRRLMSTNFVVFLNANSSLFRILFGGDLEGRSLNYSYEDSSLVDKMEIRNSELFFQEYLDYLWDLEREEDEYIQLEKEEALERKREEERIKEIIKKNEIEPKKVVAIKEKEIKKENRSARKPTKKQIEKNHLKLEKELEFERLSKRLDPQYKALIFLANLSKAEIEYKIKIYRTPTTLSLYTATDHISLSGITNFCNNCSTLMTPVNNNGHFWHCHKCNNSFQIFENVNNDEDLEKVIKEMKTRNKKS